MQSATTNARGILYPATAISTGIVKTHNIVVNIIAALQVVPSIPF